MRRALVTGFGAFPGVEHNPTAVLARQVDGCRLDDVELVGAVLPVSWRRGPDQAISLAREIEAVWVVGLGVAVSRSHPEVEAVAVCSSSGNVDVDGSCDAVLTGPAERCATVDVEGLAAGLGAGISRDAGRYVCNAWLYRVTGALDVPVGFIHVPPSGIEVHTLLRGLAVLC